MHEKVPSNYNWLKSGNYIRGNLPASVRAHLVKPIQFHWGRFEVERGPVT
jgi:hypothetical protein